MSEVKGCKYEKKNGANTRKKPVLLFVVRIDLLWFEVFFLKKFKYEKKTSNREIKYEKKTCKYEKKTLSGGEYWWIYFHFRFKSFFVAVGMGTMGELFKIKLDTFLCVWEDMLKSLWSYILSFRNLEKKKNKIVKYLESIFTKTYAWDAYILFVRGFYKIHDSIIGLIYKNA